MHLRPRIARSGSCHGQHAGIQGQKSQIASCDRALEIAPRLTSRRAAADRTSISAGPGPGTLLQCGNEAVWRRVCRLSRIPHGFRHRGPYGLWICICHAGISPDLGRGAARRASVHTPGFCSRKRFSVGVAPTAIFPIPTACLVVWGAILVQWQSLGGGYAPPMHCHFLDIDGRCLECPRSPLPRFPCTGIWTMFLRCNIIKDIQEHGMGGAGAVKAPERACAPCFVPCSSASKNRGTD